MINSDEDLPKPAQKLLIPPLLDTLGVEELAVYIGLLESEIRRVNAAISTKQAFKTAAAAFFKAAPNSGN